MTTWEEGLYYNRFWPVTVAGRTGARSEAGIVGSNPTQGMDVWYVYVFILCLSYLISR
jgi:hypothetical protein